MEKLETATGMMFSGVFMASTDLKDAYYTIPIREYDKPFVCFQWSNKVFMHHVMPFGLTSVPRIFTKLNAFTNGLSHTERYQIIQLY